MKNYIEFLQILFGKNEITPSSVKKSQSLNIYIEARNRVPNTLRSDRNYYLYNEKLFINEYENYERILIARNLYQKNGIIQKYNINREEFINRFNDEFVPSLPLQLFLLDVYTKNPNLKPLSQSLESRFGYGQYDNFFLTSTLINWSKSEICHYHQNRNRAYSFNFNKKDLIDFIQANRESDSVLIDSDRIKIDERIDFFNKALGHNHCKTINSITNNYKLKLYLTFPFNIEKTSGITYTYFSIDQEKICINLNVSSGYRTPILLVKSSNSSSH
ncbi:MAG: hypothetical protein JXR48_11995 [Candidatus Delongbacteria bacterium]|nr:hypothetical protein [Candidatus Delongbacteria bacterium]MBN2835674.1 hypothetical protein [Candidatus Delongbacteria bacterium]